MVPIHIPISSLHTGLSTPDITATTKKLQNNLTRFRTPPPTYYKLKDKKEEILSIGADPEEFCKLGILIDKESTEFKKEESEDELNTAKENVQNIKFLLQIFSLPFFEEVDTFFIEIIQRQNSRGFGGGNIRALAQSIIEYQKETWERKISGLQQPTKKISRTM